MTGKLFKDKTIITVDIYQFINRTIQNTEGYKI